MTGQRSRYGPAQAQVGLLYGPLVVDEEIEEPLVGGDVTEGIVRVGDTIRRPRTDESPSVESLLQFLERTGFDGAPRFRGLDDRGRQVLSFVPGEVAGRPWPHWVADDDRIASVARLVRRYDDAAHGFGLPAAATASTGPDIPGIPPSTMGPATFVAHLDICPENVVFRNEQAIALIDFDLARPANRLREVCNMLQWWAPLMPEEDRYASVREIDVFARAALMVQVYGLDPVDRAQIVQALQNSSQRAWHAMRRRAEQRGGPWRRLWDQGIGDRIVRRQQWLAGNAEILHKAVTVDAP